MRTTTLQKTRCGNLNIFLSNFVIVFLAAASLSVAQVPTYEVEVIASFNTTTMVLGASENGRLVGWQVDFNGQLQAFVASSEDGIQLLPLMPGYVSSAAFDINQQGIVVGAINDSGFPTDSGFPAVWIPDGQGGYEVQILTTLKTAIGGFPVRGGIASHINDQGDIVGFSRIQGFIGGPATKFSLTEEPVDLGGLGFTERIGGINENGVIVGGGLRMNLDTLDVVDLGLPEPDDGQNFTFVLGYAINDLDEVVAAAHRATAGNSRWLTFRHNDVEQWQPVDPGELATVNVGFYDNNNRGDIAFRQGVLFRSENQIVRDLNDLLEPEFSDWDVAIGFIDNHRQFLTTGINTNSGESALLILRPVDKSPLLGDVNLDGLVNLLDVQPFAERLSNGTFQGEADVNQDGNVDLLDVAPFVALLSG